MRIAIVGAGAMGSIFGARLAEAGEDVLLVDVSTKLVEKLNADGVSVNTKDGTTTTRVPATTRPPDEPVDSVLFFVKCYHTQAAVDLAAPLVGDETTVATLQNGWGNGDVLAEKFGRDRTVVGVTYNSGTVQGVGAVAHTNVGPTFIGPYAAEASADLARPIGESLARAGFEVNITAEATTEVWRKLVLNCATLPTSALTRLTAGRVGDSNVLEVAHTLAREATSVARALGHDIDPEERVSTITTNLRAVGPGKASMLQDVEAGRRTEIGVISGAVVAAAADHDIDVPLTKAILYLVQGLEEGAELA
jgi:2-dehydropantoate 2-reductase